MPLPFDHIQLENHLSIVMRLAHGDEKASLSVKNAAKMMIDSKLLLCIEELLVDSPYHAKSSTEVKKRLAINIVNFIQQIAKEERFKKLKTTLQALNQAIQNNERAELHKVIPQWDRENFIERLREGKGAILITIRNDADERLRCQAATSCQQGDTYLKTENYNNAKMAYQAAVNQIKQVQVTTEQDKTNLKNYEDAIICCELKEAENCWHAGNYPAAEAHYQIIINHIKQSGVKTKEDKEDLKCNEYMMLRCQMKICQQQADDCWKLRRYKEAELHYQAALDKVKKITFKAEYQKRKLQFYEAKILDCIAANLGQLAEADPILLFAAINRFQQDPVSLIKTLVRLYPEGHAAFRIIAQCVPAVLPLICEYASKVDDAVLLAGFIALAKKEKLPTHHLSGAMYAFQNAVSKMDRDFALELQQMITAGLASSASLYHSLYLKKGFTSIFQSYGETKISIAMKDALNARLKEFDRGLNDRPVRRLAASLS